MTNLIEIKGVTHAYATASGPLPVLDNLNLSVPEGEFAAVVGPSGCGKSTLTRLVAGLMKPDRGEVWLHGELVKSPRKTVGMAFQNPVLLEWRTILQNVMLPLEIVAPQMAQKDRVARATELLALVALAMGLMALAAYMVALNRMGEAFGTVLTTIPLVIQAIRNIGQAQAMNAMADALAQSMPVTAEPMAVNVVNAPDAPVPVEEK